jgi:flagellar biosynthesis protein FliR
VTALGPDTILAAFILFCRIGGCLMLMPGFSSPRVPMQVRLFLAIAVTLALAPLVLPAVSPSVAGASPFALGRLIVSETLTGALIGLLGRLFFLALQTMATAASMAIGFSTMPGAPVEDTEPVGPMVSLITLTATVLLFTMDGHWEVLRGLAMSYRTLPPAEGFAGQFGLIQLADRLAESFLLTLRITSPFIIYSIVVNLAVGVINKLTPAIPVYFIALPFILAGGLFLLYVTIGEMLRLFMAGFGSWLAGG